MQIVIDIPDEYKKLLDNGDADGSIRKLILLAVANGTPLSKGHGRLIDAEQLMNYCQNQIDGHKYADCNVIARFPTILEADREE